MSSYYLARHLQKVFRSKRKLEQNADQNRHIYPEIRESWFLNKKQVLHLSEFLIFSQGSQVQVTCERNHFKKPLVVESMRRVLLARYFLGSLVTNNHYVLWKHQKQWFVVPHLWEGVQQIVKPFSCSPQNKVKMLDLDFAQAMAAPEKMLWRPPYLQCTINKQHSRKTLTLYFSDHEILGRALLL